MKVCERKRMCLLTVTCIEVHGWLSTLWVQMKAKLCLYLWLDDVQWVVFYISCQHSSHERDAFFLFVVKMNSNWGKKKNNYTISSRFYLYLNTKPMCQFFWIKKKHSKKQTQKPRRSSKIHRPRSQAPSALSQTYCFASQSDSFKLRFYDQPSCRINNHTLSGL